MAGFEPWHVVRVPFPYTDRPVRQWRPAVVVAADKLTASHGLLWVLMVTSADNRRWADDVVVTDLDAAGLPAPSVVRTAKIATIDAGDAERIGALPRADRKKIAARVAQILKPMRAGAG